MKTASKLIVFLYGLVMLGSALRIEITPDVYTEENAGPANITCQLDTSDGMNANIVLLQLLNKDGQPVVFLRKGGMLSLGDDYSDSSKFQAEGIINLHDPYLQFSIADPKKTDAGIYTCKMFFSDSSGSLQEQKASGSLILQKMDVNEVVRQLKEGVSKLKKELEVQNAKGNDMTVKISQLEESNKKLQDKAHDMTVKISQLEESDKKLQDKAHDMTVEISQLEESDKKLQDKVTYRSAFTARLSGDRILDKNKDVIFDKVITRQGEGYNSSSGVFTAPRDGLYSFELSMTAFMRGNVSCCQGEVILMVNGVEVGRIALEVGAPSTNNGDRKPQASVHHVTFLARGNQVKARTIYFKMNWSWASYFSGFMIQAD